MFKADKDRILSALLLKNKEKNNKDKGAAKFRSSESN
jgi:hypothetical protein